MDPLNDMALYVEVVKAMSFRRAAEATGIPNSTLSRRISALEKAIGLRLLHRTTRKIEVTEAGLLYFERCKRIVEEARLAHEQLGEMLAQPRGVLRVSMPEGYANIFLSPLIAEFARLHPGISFEFDLSSRRIDLVTEPFDVAIRMGEPPISNLIARPITSLARYLYASPRYLERAGVPTQPAHLAQHECLRPRTAEADVWALHPVGRKGATVEVRIGGRFALNSVVMLQRFATLDLGIAVLAEDVVAQDVDAGRLCRVLPDWRATPVSVHAVTETRLLPAKTQRFIDFLRERLARRE